MMRWLRPLAWLALALLAGAAPAGEACRIAYDMGSSGIRAGASNSAATAQADIDFLGPQWAGRGLDETLVPTIAALRQLPERAGLDAGCVRVGGGFSAWRLALEQDSERLAGQLATIAAASGVAVLVVPQAAEGRYGYLGARRALAGRLSTSHILDIGGGSLQVAGERSAFGAALGQKIWHRQLCQALRGDGACTLAPLGDDELQRARALLAERLQALPAALPETVTLTAISRPVSRGVLPAVERLLALKVGDEGLSRAQLAAAIEQLAPLSLADSAAVLGAPPKYLGYLLSDLLLVEGLLRSTGAGTLKIAELDLTNLPGLLADDQAYAWAAHYGCYLQRLRTQGLAAYASDPASCPAP